MGRITDNVETRPSFITAVALSLIDRGRRATEAASDLGVATQRLMWLFRDGSPRTQRDVSDSLGLEQSTVNRQVNAALEANLLRRYREPGQSASLLEATAEGFDRFERELMRGMNILDRALSAVPAAERPAFIAHLGAFAEAYDAATHAV